jgi:hypothetical protein
MYLKVIQDGVIGPKLRREVFDRNSGWRYLIKTHDCGICSNSGGRYLTETYERVF